MKSNMTNLYLLPYLSVLGITLHPSRLHRREELREHGSSRRTAPEAPAGLLDARNGSCGLWLLPLSHIGFSAACPAAPPPPPEGAAAAAGDPAPRSGAEGAPGEGTRARGPFGLRGREAAAAEKEGGIAPCVLVGGGTGGRRGGLQRPSPEERDSGKNPEPLHLSLGKELSKEQGG